MKPSHSLLLAFATLVALLWMVALSGCATVPGGGSELTICPLVNGSLSSNPQAWNDPMGAMFLR